MIPVTLEAEDKPASRFVVIGHRSPLSVCGAMSAVCKGEDGQPRFYASRQEAQADADRWNQRLTTRNVHYTVETQ